MVRDTAWRDDAAASLAGKHIPRLELDGPALVMEDRLREVEAAFHAVGTPVSRWRRRAWGGGAASPWPAGGGYGTVALRLPRVKAELEMCLHATASVLRPGGRLLVYGAGDEGVRSAAGRIEAAIGRVRTVATGRRCRLLEAVLSGERSGRPGGLSAWRTTSTLTLGGEARTWVSYPGVFADGRLDPGTALLLDILADARGLPDEARVLDFGCGSGVIAGALGVSRAGWRFDLLDVDSVALEAARENVPGARRLLADGWPEPAEPPYDLIVSNPPYHQGKAETTRVVERLIAGAPARMTRRGRLALVVQRRLPVANALADAFARVDVLAKDRVYAVYHAAEPRRR